MKHLKNTFLTPKRQHIRNVDSKKQTERGYVTENKENCTTSDTISFTESVLDASAEIQAAECIQMANNARKRSRNTPNGSSPMRDQDTVVDVIVSPTSLGYSSQAGSSKIPSPSRAKQQLFSMNPALAYHPPDSSNIKHEGPFVFSNHSPSSSSKQDSHSAAATTHRLSPSTRSPTASDRHYSPTSSSVFSSPQFSSSKSDLASDRYYLNVQQKTRSRSASPTPLSQCNSQCSSTSDVSQGYFSLKSSHNVISWSSVKLRKSVNKSFAIKNTSHKKLTLKMEIIGPGFQVSFH